MTASNAVEEVAADSAPAKQSTGDSEITERQVWFGPVDRPLFGWLTVPAGTMANTGVVLCLPMAEEGRCAHRTFRRLSRELAARGMLALRFDYDGTGDSAGSLAEPGRVAAWLSSVAAAIELLRSCGVHRVDGVGMRLGATIAAAAAGRDENGGTMVDVQPSPFSSLVLWDPCASGRDFLREGRALHSLGENRHEIIPDGAVDTPGFRFSPDTVEEMNSLDLSSIASTALAARTLVLVRKDRRLKGKVMQRLSAEPGVEWDVALDQQLLIDVSPSSAAVPLQSMHRIVNWLAAAVDSRASMPRPLAIPEGDQAVIVAIPPALGDPSDQPALEGLASDFRAATQVVERPQSFGSRALRGVITEPLSGATTLPWVVMLNVAVEHYLGPGRLWVQLARELAGRGFRCLRLDQSGVGDSPTRPGQDEDVIFAPEWISELPEIVDELRTTDRRVVLMGLCSGAYSALEAALHTEVDAIFAVNPRLRILETSKGMPQFDPNRRAARPPSKYVARIAVWRTNLGGGIWRVYRQFAFWHAPMAVLFAVARTGADIRMISGPRDSRGYREVVVWSLARALKGTWTTRLHFDALSAIDHSLLAQSSQALIRDLATEYLVDRYQDRPVDLPDVPSGGRGDPG